MNAPLDFEADGKQLPYCGQFGCTPTILGKFDRLIYWVRRDVSGVSEVYPGTWSSTHWACKGSTTDASSLEEEAQTSTADDNRPDLRGATEESRVELEARIRMHSHGDEFGALLWRKGGEWPECVGV